MQYHKTKGIPALHWTTVHSAFGNRDRSGKKSFPVPSIPLPAESASRRVNPGGLFDPTLKSDQLEADERRRRLQQQRQVREGQLQRVTFQPPRPATLNSEKWPHMSRGDNTLALKLARVSENQQQLNRDASLAELLLSGPTFRETLARESDVSRTARSVSPNWHSQSTYPHYELQHHHKQRYSQQEQLQRKVQNVPKQTVREKSREMHDAQQQRRKPSQRPEQSSFSGQRIDAFQEQDPATTAHRRSRVSRHPIVSGRSMIKQQHATKQQNSSSNLQHQACRQATVPSFAPIDLQGVLNSAAIPNSSIGSSEEASDACQSGDCGTFNVQGARLKDCSPTEHSTGWLNLMRSTRQRVNGLRKKLANFASLSSEQEGYELQNQELARSQQQYLEALLVELAETLRTGPPGGTTEGTAYLLSFLQQQQGCELQVKSLKHLLKRVQSSLRVISGDPCPQHCRHPQSAATPSLAAFHGHACCSFWEEQTGFHASAAHAGAEVASADQIEIPTHEEQPTLPAADDVPWPQGGSAKPRCEVSCARQPRHHAIGQQLIELPPGKTETVKCPQPTGAPCVDRRPPSAKSSTSPCCSSVGLMAQFFDQLCSAPSPTVQQEQSVRSQRGAGKQTCLSVTAAACKPSPTSNHGRAVAGVASQPLPITSQPLQLTQPQVQLNTGATACKHSLAANQGRAVAGVACQQLPVTSQPLQLTQPQARPNVGATDCKHSLAANQRPSVAEVASQPISMASQTLQSKDQQVPLKVSATACKHSLAANQGRAASEVASQPVSIASQPLQLTQPQAQLNIGATACKHSLVAKQRPTVSEVASQPLSMASQILQSKDQQVPLNVGATACKHSLEANHGCAVSEVASQPLSIASQLLQLTQPQVQLNIGATACKHSLVANQGCDAAEVASQPPPIASQPIQLEESQLQSIREQLQSQPSRRTAHETSTYRDILRCVMRAQEAECRAAETLKLIEDNSDPIVGQHETTVSAHTRFEEHGDMEHVSTRTSTAYSHRVPCESATASNELQQASSFKALPLKQRELSPDLQQRILAFQNHRRELQLKDEPLLHQTELQHALRQMEDRIGIQLGTEGGIAGVWTLHAAITEQILQQEVQQVVHAMNSVVTTFVDQLLKAEVARMAKIIEP